jgi:hypothetical protein
MDEVAMYLRTIARGAYVIEEIFAMVEDLCALCKFPEEGTARVVLIANKFHTER